MGYSPKGHTELDMTEATQQHVCVCVCVCACSISQLCPTLCDCMDYGLPGSSVDGILQARILLLGLPCPTSGDLPDPGIEPTSLISPALVGGFFTTEPPGKPIYIHTHIYIHTYIYTYTDTHIYTHIYIHVYIQAHIYIYAIKLKV